MAESLQDSGVAFVHFPGAVSSPQGSAATIATFPRPAGCGRTRTGPTERDDAGILLGESPEMIEVSEQVRRIAPSQATVMLIGESGTGKEVVAGLLHSCSTRANGPFVGVNCGAIPANLVEAELFGYERGAFTGAVRQHQGYFERAAGGTLFLDEIAEMPLELQTKLLRVLETGRMVRVGGSEEIAVDVRIITATNRVPEAVIRERRLREDLYYRLAVFVLRLPPLRQRGDDIELLACAFLERLNREHGTRKRFDPGTLAVARAHGWPGNVRELKNTIDYIVAAAPDERVEPSDLPERLGGAAGQAAPTAAALPADVVADAKTPFRPIADELRELERRRMAEALVAAGGVKTRAAQLIDMPIRTFTLKLKQYKL